MSSLTTDELLTVNETARRLRQTPDTIRRKIAAGQLSAVRVGERGPLRVPESALADLLQPASSAAHPPSLGTDSGCVALEADTEDEEGNR